MCREDRAVLGDAGEEVGDGAAGDEENRAREVSD
jgi:hypothetical protein